MVYPNFRSIICIFFVFGIGKLLIRSNGSFVQPNLLYKMWSLSLAIAMGLSYFITSKRIVEFSIKRHLEEMSNVNDLVVNICIILLNFFSGPQKYEELYSVINKMFDEIRLNIRSQKILCFKIYLSLLVPFFIFIAAIAVEIIFFPPPYVFILRIPVFLSTLYVCLHLYLILFILKIMNQIIFDVLSFNSQTIEEITPNKNLIISIFSTDIKFVFSNDNHGFNFKCMCKTYDDASTCVFYLEKLYGLQMVLAIWLTFSNAVVGVTLITCNQSNLPWLQIVKSVLPFSWWFMACYIAEQIRKQVKRLETLIVKYLIDYRCDQSTRNILQTFKQLLGTNDLNFTANNVFRLNYAMVLGTIINIITYSIILIQLFLSD